MTLILTLRLLGVNLSHHPLHTAIVSSPLPTLTLPPSLHQGKFATSHYQPALATPSFLLPRVDLLPQQRPYQMITQPRVQHRLRRLSAPMAESAQPRDSLSSRPALRSLDPERYPLASVTPSRIVRSSSRVGERASASNVRNLLLWSLLLQWQKTTCLREHPLRSRRSRKHQ